MSMDLKCYPNYLVSIEVATWLWNQGYQVNANYYIDDNRELYFSEDCGDVLGRNIPIPSIIDMCQWLADLDIIVKIGRVTDNKFYFDLLVHFDPSIYQGGDSVGQEYIYQAYNDAFLYIFKHWKYYTTWKQRMKLVDC